MANFKVSYSSSELMSFTVTRGSKLWKLRLVVMLKWKLSNISNLLFNCEDYDCRVYAFVV